MVMAYRTILYPSIMSALIFAFSFSLGATTVAEHTPVSPENEQFIRAILSKLNINELVTAIKAFDKEDIEEYGEQNLIVARNVPESEPLLAKIKNYFSAHSPLTTYNILIGEKWFNTLSHEEKIFLVGHEASHILLGHIKERYLDPKNPQDMIRSREQENEADRHAALRLACIGGGIDFLKRLIPPSENNPLAAHDSPQQRIAHLEALKQS